jgi:outer membrane protein, multidrug efflux system
MSATPKGDLNMTRKDRTASLGTLRSCGLALLFCLATVAGCAVGPDYKPVQTHVPPAWTGPVSPSAVPLTPAAASNLVHWWTRFNDPTLTSLVNRAVKSNLDVKLAEARIRQARAARAVAAAGLGPTIDVAGSFQHSRSPGISGASLTGSRNGQVTNAYQAGLDAGWGLDVFGGVRRAVEAADADLQAAVEDRRDVCVTLAAEVAVDYIDLRSYQQRIATARENLKTEKQTAELTHKRFKVGFVSALDVANADAQVATTAAQIPLLEMSARQAIYNLSILLGLEPAALMEELSSVSPTPPAPPAVPIGVPSELIRRRPDIRMAEAQIHAATARIGVATADLFPKFSITGSLGFQAGILGSLFDWVNRFWSFGPSVGWRVFDNNGILSNIELQKAFQEESFITYQKTVLNAMQEVENALVASAKEEERRKALVDAVAANQKAVKLATLLYTQGESDFLNVLVAQRSLYSTDDALAQSTGALSTDLVSLYKALGGGWKVPPTEKESE